MYHHLLVGLVYYVLIIHSFIIGIWKVTCNYSCQTNVVEKVVSNCTDVHSNNAHSSVNVCRFMDY